MDLEWQDRRLLRLLNENGPLGASEQRSPHQEEFLELDFIPMSQDGEQLGEKPRYEARRVRRLAEQELLTLKAEPVPGQFRLAITAQGRDALRGRAR